MNTEEIHIGDTVRFECQVVEDGVVVPIPDAQLMQIVFQKPNGLSFVETGAFLTNGNDGIFCYTALPTDLDTAGVWSIQGFVRTLSGEWNTRIQKISVFPNLSRPVEE
jgi:hypothetical protein